MCRWNIAYSVYIPVCIQRGLSGFHHIITHSIYGFDSGINLLVYTFGKTENKVKTQFFLKKLGRGVDAKEVLDTLPDTRTELSYLIKKPACGTADTFPDAVYDIFAYFKHLIG